MAYPLGNEPHIRDSLSRSSSASDEQPWALYADGIRLIAMRALGDPALADEVAQESVTRAIASLATAREQPIIDVGGFVFGIARHLIADVHRARGRTQSLDSVPEPRTQSPTALEIVIADEDARKVRSALHELAPSDRNLLRLFYVDGLDADEIGQRLGETSVTIRKRKSRALERLRRAFTGHESSISSTDTR